MDWRPDLFCLLLALSAPAGLADAVPEGLEGRSVTFNILTYDHPELPLFDGKRHPAIVGDGVEFGLGPEGAQNGIDVVPVQIDVSARRIEFSYAATLPGGFMAAEFNGYVLRFPTECVLLTGAALVPEGTTLGLKPEDLRVEPQALYLNVAGLTFDREDRITVAVDVMDCPIG